MTPPTSLSSDDVQKLMYGLSHDMGAPLRAMVQLSELLGQRAQEKLSEKERYWLDLIRENGSHAQSMLEGVLAYSRLSTRCSADKPLNLEQLIETALQRHQSLIEHRQANVDRHIEEAEIIACEEHWTTLIDQLLHNALLYQAKDNDTRIAIHIAQKDGDILCTIEDNGIGVKDQQLQQLGAPFKRFQTQRDYPGVGMGLSLCERIAQLNNGSMRYQLGSLGGLAVSYRQPIIRH